MTVGVCVNVGVTVNVDVGLSVGVGEFVAVKVGVGSAKREKAEPQLVNAGKQAVKKRSIHKSLSRPTTLLKGTAS